MLLVRLKGRRQQVRRLTFDLPKYVLLLRRLIFADHVTQARPQLSVEVIDEDEDDPEMPGMEPVSDDEDEDEDEEDEVVEEPKESAEAELSKLPIDYQQNLSLSYIPRAPIKGLELADLCVLQARTCHRVHPWPSCPCL